MEEQAGKEALKDLENQMEPQISTWTQIKRSVAKCHLIQHKIMKVQKTRLKFMLLNSETACQNTKTAINNASQELEDLNYKLVMTKDLLHCNFSLLSCEQVAASTSDRDVNFDKQPSSDNKLLLLSSQIYHVIIKEPLDVLALGMVREWMGQSTTISDFKFFVSVDPCISKEGLEMVDYLSKFGFSLSLVNVKALYRFGCDYVMQSSEKEYRNFLLCHPPVVAGHSLIDKRKMLHSCWGKLKLKFIQYLLHYTSSIQWKVNILTLMHMKVPKEDVGSLLNVAQERYRASKNQCSVIKDGKDGVLDILRSLKFKFILINDIIDCICLKLINNWDNGIQKYFALECDDGQFSLIKDYVNEKWTLLGGSLEKKKLYRIKLMVVELATEEECRTACYT
ncbi:hypothetical protein ACH5RR_008094 [Cinchona calisaya]|uniref:Uncharacterized protein n=1 Tax=Cinchona calisaya TaxID=153742 RepID=A0ABD3ADB1_9GENT